MTEDVPVSKKFLAISSFFSLLGLLAYSPVTAQATDFVVSGFFSPKYVKAGVFSNEPSPVLNYFLGPVDRWGRKIDRNTGQRSDLGNSWSGASSSQFSSRRARYYPEAGIVSSSSGFEQVNPSTSNYRADSSASGSNSSASEWDVSSLLSSQ